jgi:thioesterase domain-containing protein
MVSSFLSKDLNKKTFLPALRVISYQDKDKTPIIFMPPIGGQIYWYFELINKMELKKTCYAFESPGLYGDTTLENIEQVVQFYLEQIRLLDIKKCIIIGWSFGASLAYELSKCIENHSEISVVASILIDPEYVKNKKNGISNLLTELYESKDLRFNLKPSEINEMLLKNKVEDVLKNIDIFSSDENVKRLVKNTIRVYLKNISNLINYTPSGKIKNIYLIEAAFFADEETLIAEEEKFWGDFCDKMSYHKIIGDHYSIINGKDMSKLLTILKNILRDSF